MMLHITSIADDLSAGSGVSFLLSASLSCTLLISGPKNLVNGVDAMHRKSEEAGIRFRLFPTI